MVSTSFLKSRTKLAPYLINQTTLQVIFQCIFILILICNVGRILFDWFFFFSFENNFLALAIGNCTKVYLTLISLLTGSKSFFTTLFLCLPDRGYFMRFDTKLGHAGQAALLESRILYPRRKEKCLQFFYRLNGSPQDKLVIWVKKDDGTGNVRRMEKLHTITGKWKCFLCAGKHWCKTTLARFIIWKLAQVPNVNPTFICLNWVTPDLVPMNTKCGPEAESLRQFLH